MPWKAFTFTLRGSFTGGEGDGLVVEVGMGDPRSLFVGGIVGFVKVDL
jgi:hypothetical protein